MVAEVHRLGALQVRVAGHRPVDVLLRALEQRAISAVIARLRLRRALARVHRQIGHHLVVARARRVQPPADRPDDLGQTPLDRHVDVLVVGDRTRKRPSAQLARDRVEPGQQRVAILDR